jgi:hypothetical protein
VSKIVLRRSVNMHCAAIFSKSDMGRWSTTHRCISDIPGLHSARVRVVDPGIPCGGDEDGEAEQAYEDDDEVQHGVDCGAGFDGVGTHACDFGGLVEGSGLSGYCNDG